MIKKFESFLDAVDTDKMKRDISDILVELVDAGFEVKITPSSYSYYIIISIVKFGYGERAVGGVGLINQNFNLIDIKDYLDTVVEYISSDYEYDMQVNYLQAFSSKIEEFDNYELHLDKRVCSFRMVFGEFKMK